LYATSCVSACLKTYSTSAGGGEVFPGCFIYRFVCGLRGSGCIERGRFAPAHGALKAGAVLLLLFVFFDQCRAGGEDRRKGQEEAPMSGPQRWAIKPATAVISPPNRNRMA
jgi:hypothetical protein